MEHLETISSKEAREQMARVISEVAYGHKRYALTRHGKEEVVLISYEEWVNIARLLQKIEDMEDIRDAEEAMRRIKKGEETFSHEEVKRALGL